MQAVGTDNKIKSARSRLFEGDQDAIHALLDCGDRVVEQIAHARLRCFVQDCRQVAAKNLILRHDPSPAERFDWHLGTAPSG